MELPSTRLRSLPLFSPALLEVVTSPLLPATSTYESYECCTHEDSVATGEVGSQKQIGVLWPDQETQETQGIFLSLSPFVAGGDGGGSGLGPSGGRGGPKVLFLCGRGRR